ncbi:MAG: class I SAM-dependent methyltransferase [Candidatus Dormiibacterota bacterium]
MGEQTLPSRSVTSASAEGDQPAGAAIEPRELPAGVARQEHYRREYRRRRPRWRDSTAIYRDLVARHVGPESKVLDVGCGHADFLASAFALSPHIYGLDPDAGALARNPVIKQPVVGTVEHIPLPDQFFDLVCMAWVAEHLEHPFEAAQEIRRVLRPGGRLLFLTPNAWNYNTWLVRAVPNRYHEFFTRRLYGRQERDTYPVRYRLNTESKVDRVMTAANLKKVRFIRNGDPSYISFNPTLFTMACGIETVLELPWLRRARVHIIALYQR